MKELEIIIKGRGEVKDCIMTQVKRSESAYLYEVLDTDTQKRYYEVFRRKINKMYGNVSYPQSKSFGVWAWTYPTLEKAIAKFEQL